MVLKIIGLTFVFLVCSAIGLLKSQNLSKRVCQLELFCSSIKQISTEIRYFASPSNVVIKKLASNDEFEKIKLYQKCEENIETGYDFKTAWEKAIEQSIPLLSLNDTDIELIKSFGQGFGTTDVEGQIANCEEYEALLKTKLEGARNDKNNKGKMYSSIGVLSGLFLIIFFI